MSGDSPAEMTVEQDGQTATATSPEVPPAHAQDPAQEPVARPAQETDSRPAMPVEQPVRAESNGHAETTGHAETNGRADTNGHAPSVEAAAQSAADTAVADPSPQPSADRPALAITPDVERPAFGPRILGVAEPVKPLPSKKAAAPARKRRRRPSAAERHRRAFFSALTDLRRGAGSDAEPAPDSAPEAEAQPDAIERLKPDAPAAPDVAQGEASAAAEPAQPETPAAPVAAPAQPPTPLDLSAAVELVGGPEVIKEALKPKQDEKGQPLKWAAVCAQAAEGLKPGDPVFSAWVRLAATPVREVKAQLPRPPEQARPAGRESGGRRNGSKRAGEGAGRRDRPRRDDRSNRQEYASHAHDGTLRKSVRIVTGHDEDQERRERERVRKEQREAKRRVERERLARLGY